ncbi:MAG: ABC transporter substrate-binding protein [Bacteroidota bacterium]
MLKCPRLFIILAILAFVVSGSFAQERFQHSEDAERIFNEGLELFREGKHLAAVTAFDRVAKLAPLNQRSTAAHIMKAKALLALDETLEASRGLRMFIASYGWSSYVADAEYMLAVTLVRIRRYDDAMQSLLSAWRHAETSDSSRLTESISGLMDQIIERNLSTADLHGHLAGTTRAQERRYFWLKIAEKEFSAGNVVAAGIAADSLDAHYRGHPYSSKLAGIRFGVAQRSAVKIGALMPLMKSSEPSAVREIGNDVYNGMLLALEEYQAGSSRRVRVSMETRDTERDPMLASRYAQELAEDMDVIAIVGPVFSQTTLAAIGPANARGVPLITPTANSNGIAVSGSYIFQANPDYENRGRAMARYAVTTRGFRTFAVLASSDAHGKPMAEAFSAEVIRLGGTVLTVESYQRGASDLSQQLSNIRRAAMLSATEPMISFAGRLHQGDLVKLIQLGVSRRTLDSLIEFSSLIPATRLLGPAARRLIDSMQINVLMNEPKIDSLEYPATGIDGVYFPIGSPDEIGVVSSQLVYFNIKTQMLGSGEWNDIAELDANKRYCRGVIFESDSYIVPSSPEYNLFAERYYGKFNKRPSKSALYGYDTIRLVLELIGRGASTREALRSALDQTREYNGLHAKIGLTPRRVNSWLHILQYDNDMVEKLGEVNVDEPVGE